ncbi:MAG: hypothetical protein AAF366_15025 [Pseudomonadota bacterium]
MTGPREFPDVIDHLPTLQGRSAPFRISWARQEESFADRRIASVVAIATAPPVRSFHPETVSAIRPPVTLLTGGADTEAPTDQCAAWLCDLHPGSRDHDLGEDVGHYTFLDNPADRSLVGKVDILTDRPGVDRRDVHRRSADLVLEALP